jgi:exosortase E/protease (VPEID-CTERM system)
MKSDGCSARDQCPQSGAYAALHCRLLGRLYLLAFIFAAEAILVLGPLKIVPGIHLGVTPTAIVSFAVFLGLGHSWLKAQRDPIHFNFLFLGGYLACVAAMLGIHAVASHRAGGWYPQAATVAITTLFYIKVPLLALACIPLRAWVNTIRGTGLLWLYACIAGLLAWSLLVPSQSLWDASGTSVGHSLQRATFASVQAVLHHLRPDATVDAATFTIRTPRCDMEIAYPCSGMEGLGLIFAFTSIWLWYYRKECRFPQVLLLIPCGLVLIWVLNVVRLVALFLIGDLYSNEVSDVGFHSHFGWIAFTAVALAFSMATQRLSWVRKIPATSTPGQSERAAVQHSGEYLGESSAIRAYLIPFLAILGATFVTKMFSGYFDHFYPVRFLVGAIAICYFWPELKKLNWRFGWLGPTAGGAVFLAWIAPAWLGYSHATSRLGADLAALSPTARWAWIGFRVAAAVITVPIAEELAFRGYLARRFVSREFDAVAFTGLTVFSIGVSSAVFGLEHMKNLMDWQHLLLGTLAGLVFALALRWRGRFGDAVVAHAVSNLLLAAWVLSMGDWAQW